MRLHSWKLFGLVLLCAAICTFAMTGCGKEPAPPIEPKPDTVGPAPEPAPADTPATAEPAPAAPAETPAPAEPEADTKADEREAAFTQAVEKASAAFDGSIDGFKKGRDILTRSIIRSRLFEDTPYIDQANALLEENEAEVNLVIEDTMQKIRNDVQALIGELQQTAAIERAEEFPREYRAFAEWKQEYESLIAFINESADVQLEKWLAEAESKAADGQFEPAIGFIQEILEIAEDTVFPRVATALKSKVTEIQTAAAKAAESGAKASAGGDDPNVIRWYDFEEGFDEKEISRGTFETDINISDSKRSLKALYLTDDKYASEKVGVQNYKETGVFLYEPDLYVSLWYYIEKPVPAMCLQTFNNTQRCNFWTTVPSPMIGVWTYFVMPLSRFEGRVPGVKNKKGDKFTEFGLFGGPGTDSDSGPKPFGLRMDNIAITRGLPLYMFPGAHKQSEGFLRKVTLNRNTDFCEMNIGVLVNLIPKLGPEAKRDTILLAGGMHMSSTFLKDFKRNHADVKIIKVKGAGSNILLSELAPKLTDALKKHKPAITVIMTGTEDILKQNDMTGALAHYQELMRICDHYGSIPVMLNTPFVWYEELEQPVTNLNSRLNQIVTASSIPLIDVYSMLTKGSNPRGNFSGKTKLSSRGHKAISAAFEKLYTIFAEQLF